jgi:RHS repeat-associated protein
MVYNLANQMTSANGNTYLYDGHNRRVKTNSNEFSAYSQDGQLLFREEAGVATYYMYLGSRLVAKRKGGVLTYIHTDNLGSAVAETNSSRTIVEPRQYYKAFGDTVGVTKDDVGYTGHKFDADLGLSYMQARYYDPVIGRFYSNDPIGFRDIHSFNRYQYVANNPYKYTDPTGMWKSKLDEIRENKKKQEDRKNRTKTKKLIELLDGNEALLKAAKEGIRYVIDSHKAKINEDWPSMGVTISVKKGVYSVSISSSSVYAGLDQIFNGGRSSGTRSITTSHHVLAIVTRKGANGRNIEISPGDYNYAAASTGVPYIVIGTRKGYYYFYAAGGKSEPLTKIEF